MEGGDRPTSNLEPPPSLVDHVVAEAVRDAEAEGQEVAAELIGDVGLALPGHDRDQRLALPAGRADLARLELRQERVLIQRSAERATARPAPWPRHRSGPARCGCSPRRWPQPCPRCRTSSRSSTADPAGTDRARRPSRGRWRQAPAPPAPAPAEAGRPPGQARRAPAARRLASVERPGPLQRPIVADQLVGRASRRPGRPPRRAPDR